MRVEDGLVDALQELRATNSALRLGEAGPPEFELLNILTLATQITKCALLREETRGVHVRDDYPGRDDYHWQRHVTLRLPDAHKAAGATVTTGLSNGALRAAARAAARRALAEDLAGFGDLAGRAFTAPGRARVEARADGVLSGAVAFHEAAAPGRPRSAGRLRARLRRARSPPATRWPRWPAGSPASWPSSAPV